MKKYKKYDSTWYDSQDQDSYDDMRKSTGDVISDFIEDTYGLGIVILALVAIAIPLVVIQVVIHLINYLSAIFN